MGYGMAAASLMAFSMVVIAIAGACAYVGYLIGYDKGYGHAIEDINDQLNREE